MSDKVYPKITQEGLESSVSILINHLSNPTWLKEAPYSTLMIKKIEEQSALLLKNIQSGLLDTTSEKDSKEVEPILEETEKLLVESIKDQFGNLNENLEDKPENYKENYGIVVRLEKIIRTLERLIHKGSSDTVKMTAMGKLIDYQQEQMSILNQLSNIEKMQKIESLTKRFFLELKKSENLEKIADRYLKILSELD